MEFKQLKSEVETVFQEISSRSAQGEMPLEDDVARFVRLAVQFQTQAREEWADECDDFVHLARELLVAVKQGRQQDAVLLTDSLDDAQAYCHRTFRD